MNDIEPRTKWNLNSFLWVNENNLPGFGRLLSSWLNVHRGFAENGAPEFPWEWGFNERTQLGFLGNAAILIGGLSVVEDCGTQRGCGQGRLDLWLRLYQNDFFIEAKMERQLNVMNLNRSKQSIERQMNAARRVVLGKKTGKSEKNVAMAFLSLKCEDENLDSLEQNTNHLISSVWETRSPHKLDAIGAIWMGPKDFKQSRRERKRKKKGWKNEHFGMVLLAGLKDQ